MNVVNPVFAALFLSLISVEWGDGQGSEGVVKDNTTVYKVGEGDIGEVGNDRINLTRIPNPDSEEVEKSGDDGDETQDGPEEDTKFTSVSSDIKLEHIDFVMLRLKHIARSSSSNITQIRALQAQEFRTNEIYAQAWTNAWELYNASLENGTFFPQDSDSNLSKVPMEYHVALIAYTTHFPEASPMYSDFNRKTRDVCSGRDISDGYDYKSLFKFLLLAIESFGKEEGFRSGRRFLYRGVGSPFALEVGQVLAFQHFLSTSASLKAAEMFSKHTLFELQGTYTTAISIKDFSLYKAEEEYLFSPFQVFQVESKHEGTHYTRYVLISHTLAPDCGGVKIESSSTPVTLRRDAQLSAGSAGIKASSGGSLYNSFGLVILCFFMKT